MDDVTATAKNEDGPQIDRWHYMDYRDGRHDRNYFEWKYFNFIQKDLAGYIIYYLMDPELKTGIGGGRIVMRLFTGGRTLGVLKHVDVSQVALDQYAAGILMDHASLTEHDQHHYEISGGHEHTAWHLTYRQTAPTIDSFKEVNPGFFPWEKVSWLVKMPRARVTGSVRVGEETFAVDGLGYTDTNWGEVMPLLSRYEWGQYNDEHFSMVFGIMFRFKRVIDGYAYCIVGEHVIPLEHAQCQVTHLLWQKDAVTGVSVPTHSSFVITKGEYRITFTSKLVQADSPGLVIHRLLPKTVVSEQVVEYQGTVEQNGTVIHTFRGRGFEEWSTRTWKKLAVTF